MDTNNSQSASGNDILYFSVFFPLTWPTDSGVVRPVNPATPLVLRMLKANVGNGFPSKTLCSSSPGLPLMAGSFIPAPPNPLVLLLLLTGYRAILFRAFPPLLLQAVGWMGDLLPGSDFEVRLNP